MKKYKVEITETLQREIEVEANSNREAAYIAKELYLNEEIVLDASDYVETDINVFLEQKRDHGRDMIEEKVKEQMGISEIGFSLRDENHNPKIKDLVNCHLYGIDAQSSQFDYFLFSRDKNSVYMLPITLKEGFTIHEIENFTIVTCDDRNKRKEVEMIKLTNDEMNLNLYELYDKRSQLRDTYIHHQNTPRNYKILKLDFPLKEFSSQKVKQLLEERKKRKYAR